MAARGVAWGARTPRHARADEPPGRPRLRYGARMPDALAPLRTALLLALGLGGCAPRSPGEPAPGEPTPAAKPPTPTLPPASGHVRDEDGTVHRASAETCAPDSARAACSDPGSHSASSCTADADCKAGAYARCVQDAGQIGPFCQCDYACATDADCKAGELCVCGDALGQGRHATCVPARCKQDSECESGVCGLSIYNNGCGTAIDLACRTALDGCKRDADCPENQVCALKPETQTWHCQGMTCAIGRPLLVDGHARTAATVARDDWHDIARADSDTEHSPARADSATEHSPARVDSATEHTDADSGAPTEHIDAATAAALAAHWQEVAALEHASVASFARFTLELLALAAPPDLLVQAQHAALDEVAHARLAWSLAGRFAGRPLGPGPLATADLAARPLAAFVAALVDEGCIGETLGAAEAELLADHAGPDLAARLRAVAADETRHAALAWRTLRWLLAVHGEPVRQAARAAAAASAARLAAESPGADGPLAPRHGLLARASLLARRRAALDTVVGPLLRATLEPLAA